MKAFKLNPSFLLGVATASTQIEGGDKNNSWFEWCKNNDKTIDHTNCLRANRHWENYKRDIELMKDMKIQIYRFSLEWSRIEPQEGKFDQKVMDRYIEEIKLLKSYNIQPLITLHHFSNPIWFDQIGGWLKRKNVQKFIEFVKFVALNLRYYCHEYCTINEPNVYAVNCFLFGEWLNQEKNFFHMQKVLKNLCVAHIKSYQILHEIDPMAHVGFAHHVQYFKPKNPKNLIYQWETNFFDKAFNDAPIKAMAWGKFSFPIGFVGCKKGKYYDYIGINYYTSNNVAHFSYSPDPKYPRNDLGWAIYPIGLRNTCIKYHQMFGGDIYITENGTCDAKDNFRSLYIYDHLRVISDLDFVKRYYQWTFLDNFEWKEGESARFGLVAYDFEKDILSIRKSGKFFEEIIKNKGVTQSMIDEYLK